MTATPPNLDSLLRRMQNLAVEMNKPFGVVERTVANVVVSQMLPAGVVKGGTAMRIRAGLGARFSTDIDAVRSKGVGIDEYVDEFRTNLEAGWRDFHGRLEVLQPASPSDVPGEYVMQPFRIRLSYRDRGWLNLMFELGHDEIGATISPEMCMSDEKSEIFAILGLTKPSPVPLLAAEHQIAQKLHACTALAPRLQTNERAHDLVDLQILIMTTSVDYSSAGFACARLFRARRQHAWPPTVILMPDWETSYGAAAEGLAVLPDVEAAISWANDLIRRLDNSRGAEGN